MRVRQARQGQRIGTRVGQRFNGCKRRRGPLPGHEETTPRMRFDEAPCDEAVVRIDDREGARANEFSELTDRRQTGPGGELAVLDQLGDALGDLVDQRN